MKKSNIIKLVVILLAIIAVVVGATTVKTNVMIDCESFAVEKE